MFFDCWNIPATLWWECLAATKAAAVSCHCAISVGSRYLLEHCYRVLQCRMWSHMNVLTEHISLAPFVDSLLLDRNNCF
jgi:hypothetical protein